jgi:hypothetical protein
MWSTSPAERIVSVPPFVEQDVGVGGGAVETPLADVTPLVPVEDELLAPQPAARTATLTTTKAARIDFM